MDAILPSPHESSPAPDQPRRLGDFRSRLQKIFTEQRNIPRRWRLIAALASGFVVLGIVFQLGMYVGVRRDAFASLWQQGYVQSITGNTNAQGMFDDAGAAHSLRTSNGIVGQVIYINGSIWTVRDLDAFEKVVRVIPQTVIMKDNFRLRPSDVHVDDPVVVLGVSNAMAQLEARLVRILPFVPHLNK